MGARFHIRRVMCLAAAWLLWAGATLGADLGEVDGNGALVLPVGIAALDGEIALEIDAVDVTEFARIVDGRLVIDLAGLVGAGAHEIMVFLFQGASVRVLETYSFVTPGGSGGGWS